MCVCVRARVGMHVRTLVSHDILWFYMYSL